MWRFCSGLLSLLLVSMPLFFSDNVMAEQGWQLSVDRDEIRVWKRREPGSSVMAFRAETTVTSTLSGLLNLFLRSGGGFQMAGQHASRGGTAA